MLQFKDYEEVYYGDRFEADYYRALDYVNKTIEDRKYERNFTPCEGIKKQAEWENTPAVQEMIARNKLLFKGAA